MRYLDLQLSSTTLSFVHSRLESFVIFSTNSGPKTVKVGFKQNRVKALGVDYDLMSFDSQIGKSAAAIVKFKKGYQILHFSDEGEAAPVATFKLLNAARPHFFQNRINDSTIAYCLVSQIAEKIHTEVVYLSENLVQSSISIDVFDFTKTGPIEWVSNSSTIVNNTKNRTLTNIIRCI